MTVRRKNRSIKASRAIDLRDRMETRAIDGEGLGTTQRNLEWMQDIFLERPHRRPVVKKQGLESLIDECKQLLEED